MKIMQISDTHGKHRLFKHLPEGDVLDHKGNIIHNAKVFEI